MEDRIGTLLIWSFLKWKLLIELATVSHFYIYLYTPVREAGKCVFLKFCYLVPYSWLQIQKSINLAKVSNNFNLGIYNSLWNFKQIVTVITDNQVNFFLPKRTWKVFMSVSSNFQEPYFYKDRMIADTKS